MSKREGADITRAPESEMEVLGSMLHVPEAVDIIAGRLCADHFYHPKHRKIFSSIIRLYDASQPVDIGTVAIDLETNGGNDISRRYLMELVDGSLGLSNVEFHLKRIIEAGMARQAEDVCRRILADIQKAEDSPQDILDAAERQIFSIRESMDRGEIVSAREAVGDAFDNLQKHGMGLETGFWILDNETTGFHQSELIIVACRPSVGKSSFCLNIIDHIAVKLKKPVLLFTLEMDKYQVLQRMICTRAGVSSRHARAGTLSDENAWAKMGYEAGEIHQAPLFIDDSPVLKISELRARARRFRKSENIEMIVIDYLQLLTGPKSESKQQEIAAISKSLKALARELRIPIIAQSQMSRNIESRGTDAEPRLSDLRESGSLEQDADVVIFLHPSPDNKKPEPIPEQTEPPGFPGSPEQNRMKVQFKIAKQRHGPRDRIFHLWFEPGPTRFVPMVKKEQPE